MTLSVLVVTPQVSLGEHIRQSLEEKTPAHIVIAENIFEAIDVFKQQNFTHAFLDTDLDDGIVLDLGLALRRIDPGLQITLISGAVNPPPYQALRPWTLLRKPFYLPELLRILDEEADFSVDLPAAELASSDEETPAAGDDLNWLEDVSKAAQHLTRLTLGSSAQAALIIRGRALWAYSGQLSQDAATELVGIISSDKKTGDLLKFIRLETTQAEHMLYATQLADEINLAMVFDAETPFSTIRSQATDLADALAFSPQTKQEELPEAVDPEVAARQKEHDDLQSLFDFGDEDEGDFPPITEILDNIPAPNPIRAASEVKNSPPISTPSGERQSSLLHEPMPTPFARKPSPIQEGPPVNSTRESSPALHFGDTRESNVVVEETRPNIPQPREGADLPATRVSKAVPRPATPVRVNDVDLAATRVSKSSPRPVTPMRVNDVDLAATRVSKATSRSEAETQAPKPDEVATTRPHSITEVAGRVLSEPASQGLYELTYACLLLPRFNSHHLTGDLAERLSEWMPNISVAFGWRLEYISVRPDYLQWVINVPPTASPGYLMRIIRKQTSQKIFDNFPRLGKENPSGDFWAPGYLIMGGSQPHPSKLVQDYIQRTRERQGMP